MIALEGSYVKNYNIQLIFKSGPGLPWEELAPYICRGEIDR
jgi:hypothetical protein